MDGFISIGGKVCAAISRRAVNKLQEISWLAGKSKFDFSKQNSFFCSSDKNERNFTMSNWIYSILINTNNDNLKRRKGKQFQLYFVVFLWGIIRMTFHCSVWNLKSSDWEYGYHAILRRNAKICNFWIWFCMVFSTNLQLFNTSL